jgi:hypothetical protein
VRPARNGCRMKAAETPDGDWQAPLAHATADLLRLSEWLAANECTHVAMEATGVYWKPVWHILDDGEFALVLANAAHVKNVPGRKTDVNDAMWLAELLAHGLIRASVVPDAQTQRCATCCKQGSRCAICRSSLPRAVRPAAISYTRCVWITPRAFCIAGRRWARTSP